MRAWGLALLAVVLAGCSGSAAVTGGHPPPGRDPRLLGPWTVISVHVAGHRSLHPDDATAATLLFRSDGLLIANGKRCGAPHFATRGGRVFLRRPRNGTCSEYAYGTARDLHVADVVDRLVGYRSLAYRMQGERLTVTAGGRSALLVRGGATPPTVGPSPR